MSKKIVEVRGNKFRFHYPISVDKLMPKKKCELLSCYKGILNVGRCDMWCTFFLWVEIKHKLRRYPRVSISQVSDRSELLTWNDDAKIASLKQDTFLKIKNNYLKTNTKDKWLKKYINNLKIRICHINFFISNIPIRNFGHTSFSNCWHFFLILLSAFHICLKLQQCLLLIPLNRG